VDEQSKLEIVVRALWDGVVPNPDNQVVIEPRWVQQTTPNAPTAFLNGVYRCEVDDGSILGRISATIEHYRKLNLPFRWKVAPSSKPSHLKSLLIEHGLIHKETLYGLVALPGQLSIPQNPAVKIEILSLANLEDWLKVQAIAWNVPPPGIAHIRRTTTQAIESGDQTYLNFIAYHGGQPVASAALRFYDDCALLMGAAVNPDMRKIGIYRTLLSHRLKIIEERRLPAVIHCLENTSAPICLKLGFEKICEIQSFENQ